MSTHEDTKVTLRPVALMTTAEVADMLGVSQETVRRLAADGSLQRVQIGPARRLVRFRSSDVEALVEDGLRVAGEVKPN